MDDVLSSALRSATYEWLDRLEALVDAADAPSRALLAETEMVRLINAWRTLLAEHEPGEDGRCPACAGRRRDRGYRCAVWVTGHRCLVASDPSRSSARHAVANGQPPAR